MLLNLVLSNDKIAANFRSVLKVFLLLLNQTLTFYVYQPWPVSKQECTRNVYIKECNAESLQVENQSLEKK